MLRRVQITVRSLALLGLVCGLTLPSQTGPANTLTWEDAFHDTGANTPLHFQAQYLDAHNQPHHLQEWRVGQQHLHRRTDDRIDLYANAATAHPPYDYIWQILDLQQHIAHRVSTAGMLHLGMLYSFYSMAHVLTRPAGSFTITPSTVPQIPGPVTHPLPLAPCSWFELQTIGQPPTRICWMPQYGIPAQLWSATPTGWRLTFQVDTLSTAPIPASTFTANTTGFQLRNLDEIQAED